MQMTFTMVMLVSNINGLWGFINKSGEITVPCIYEEINQFHEGYAKVKKNGNRTFINKKGEELL